ncbi:MAG: hypothetical protein ACXW3S_11725, partial [Rhodoplanes sp.]
ERMGEARIDRRFLQHADPDREDDQLLQRRPLKFDPVISAFARCAARRAGSRSRRKMRRRIASRTNVTRA